MSVNSVFYAESYHPIQAGSIDGTDILPHDNAIYRAHLCSEARLYEPFGDTNVTGDPNCTIFVGSLSHLTTEETLRKAMSKYGQVKNVRLVRHIVTGASRGYAFVEFASEREMRRAYQDAHHSMIDDYDIMVDYNRQQLMPGWIPRRLGGGLGGKKESGQLRFGGRERPFRAPLRPIPYDDLKKLGIPAPPEGRYMSRFQVPSPPRKSSTAREEGSHRRRLMDREENSHRRESPDLEGHSEIGDRSSTDRNRSREREERHSRRRVRDKEEQPRERSYTLNDESPPRRERSRERPTREEPHSKRSSRDKEEQSRKGSYRNEEEPNASHRKRSRDKEERSHERSSRDKEKSSHRRDRDQEERSHRRQKHSSKSHRHDKSPSQDQFFDD